MAKRNNVDISGFLSLSITPICRNYAVETPLILRILAPIAEESMNDTREMAG